MLHVDAGERQVEIDQRGDARAAEPDLAGRGGVGVTSVAPGCVEEEDGRGLTVRQILLPRPVEFARGGVG